MKAKDYKKEIEKIKEIATLGIICGDCEDTKCGDCYRNFRERILDLIKDIEGKGKIEEFDENEMFEGLYYKENSEKAVFEAEAKYLKEQVNYLKGKIKYMERYMEWKKI